MITVSYDGKKSKSSCFAWQNYSNLYKIIIEHTEKKSDQNINKSEFQQKADERKKEKTIDDRSIFNEYLLAVHL